MMAEILELRVLMTQCGVSKLIDWRHRQAATAVSES